MPPSSATVAQGSAGKISGADESMLDWAAQDFFPEPGRLEVLHFLLHLAPYASDALIILGDAGSGRSSLLAQFAGRGADNWRVVTLSAASMASERDLRKQVERALGANIPVDSAGMTWIVALLEHCRYLSKGGQHPVVLVDDAEALSVDTRALVIALATAVRAEAAPLGLVITALPSFANTDLFAALRDGGAHVFSLEPLGGGSVKGLIAHQLERRGLPKQLLTDELVAAVERRARGNVATIVNAVREFAEPKVQAPAAQPPVQPRSEPPLPPSPRAHRRARRWGRWLGVAALAMLVGLALFFQNEINRIAGPASEPAVSPAPSRGSPAPALPPAQSTPPSALDLPAFGPEPSIPRETPPANEFEAGSIDTIKGGSEAPGEREAAPASPGVVVESIIVADLLEPPHQSAADPAAEAPAPPVEEKPLPDTTVQENAAKEHASAPGRIHGNAWLLAQSGEQYTVQIMALRSEEVLRQIVARVPDSSPFAIYAFQRESGTMFALTHGLYPTRSAALAASEALPRELGKVKPWVRKLRAIHAEIRQTRTP